MSGTATCGPPEWKLTRKGRSRCGRVCIDAQGKRRFRWTKGEACSGLPLPSSSSSTTGPLAVEGLAKSLGIQPMMLEPLPLLTMGPTDSISGSGPGDESEA